MENEKPDMPQEKPKVNLSKENRDTDISKNFHGIESFLPCSHGFSVP